MSFMTTETRVMPGGLSHPIAWAIPFLWTICIIIRNKVSFWNNNFLILIAICFLWSIVQIIVKDTFEIRQLGLYFSFLYVIVVAYVHINVYKKRLFELYEYCMVIMCKISLLLWIISNVFMSSFAAIAKLFPVTGFGRNIMFVYNWMDPTSGQTQGFLLRNAGCSWEPGRFAVMICLAIAINMLRRGTSLSNNDNIKWLLIALATTFSTTGYVITALLYLLFTFKMSNLTSYIYALLLAVFFIIGALNLSFVGDKLISKFDLRLELENINYNEAWYESQEKYIAIDRFPSIYFEIDNLIHDPVIGYGKDTSLSHFSKRHSTYYSTTGGLVQMFSLYGIFLGMFFYYLLYKSSHRIAYDLHSEKGYIIFLFFLFSLISYPLFEFAVFSAIWLYDILLTKDSKKYSQIRKQFLMRRLTARLKIANNVNCKK